MRITPITTQDIILYRKVANQVLDTFTNKVLYTGNKAENIYKEVNRIGLINAHIIDNNAKNGCNAKLLYVLA